MERVSTKKQPIRHEKEDKRWTRGLPCKRYELRQTNRRLRRNANYLLRVRDEECWDDIMLESSPWLY